LEKIWKGLFYCMWLCDKPLVQQELAMQLSILIHRLSHEKAIFFLKAFYQILEIEWISIDRLRLDKYYMLIRNCLNQSFQYLSNTQWNTELLDQFNCMMLDGPLKLNSQNGIKFHIIDIFLEELPKVTKNQISPKIFNHILHPFYFLIAKAEDKQVRKRVKANIFILHLNEVTKVEENSDITKIATQLKEIESNLFLWASSHDCLEQNRDFLYSLKKQYQTKRLSHFPEGTTEHETQINDDKWIDQNHIPEKTKVTKTKKRKNT